MEPLSARIEEYCRLATHALEASNRDMHRILFYTEGPQDKGDPQKRAVAGIYAAIIQSARDCLVLLERRSGCSVACLLRSMVESYVDLCAAIIDGTYIDRMKATFYYQKRRMLESFGRGEDTLLPAAEMLDARVELEKVSAELARIEARGQTPLQIDERFDCGERWGIYERIYWQLCLRNQNNIAALETRHLQSVADDLQVLVFEESEPGEISKFYDGLTWILIDAAIRVHGVLNTGLVAGYENQMRALLTFRHAALGEGA